MRAHKFAMSLVLLAFPRDDQQQETILQHGALLLSYATITLVHDALFLDFIENPHSAKMFRRAFFQRLETFICSFFEVSYTLSFRGL